MLKIYTAKVCCRTKIVADFFSTEKKSIANGVNNKTLLFTGGTTFIHKKSSLYNLNNKMKIYRG